jgi:hypothetical protein
VTDEFCIQSATGFRVRHFSLASAPLTSVLLGLLVATSGFAVAADQKPSPNPCNLTAAEAAGMNGDFSTQVHATRDYMATIMRVLRQEKFEELDCIADHVRSNKERFPGGAWKLHVFYVALSKPVPYPQHATNGDWDSLLKPLQAWVTVHPKSVTARVALARAYLIYAYDARGEGHSNTVSDSGWKLFGERTAEGKRILDEASTLPTKCPEWYLDMLLVAQNQGWRASDARAVFDEAFKFEPDYYYNARVLANYLLPKWTGQEGATERFIQEIADRIGGTQGEIFYFQVATAPDLICGCEDDPHLSMERIVRGFEASEKQYGISMINLNLIAFLASNYRDNDAIMADKALTRVGEQWDEETWKKREDFDRIKKWAATWAPAMVKDREVKAEAEANMKTPEGVRYRPAFEKKYRELVQPCAHAQDATGKIEAVINVGANGSVENVAIYGPAGMCVYQKLRALQQTKTPVFPPPPQAPFWVKLDLDWSDLAAVAAK